MSESTPVSQPQKRPASPIAGIDYPPKFESVTEERKERKQKLTAALRLFGRLGFDEGVAGHFTSQFATPSIPISSGSIRLVARLNRCASLT